MPSERVCLAGPITSHDEVLGAQPRPVHWTHFPQASPEQFNVGVFADRRDPLPHCPGDEFGAVVGADVAQHTSRMSGSESTSMTWMGLELRFARHVRELVDDAEHRSLRPLWVRSGQIMLDPTRIHPVRRPATTSLRVVLRIQWHTRLERRRLRTLNIRFGRDLMKFLQSSLARGTFWTVGGYAATQVLRFGTSVLVARLLAPEIFGLMVIVNTLRTGAELLSDIGIGQSVVQSKNAEDPAFYNTAWTLQAVRGVILFLLCAIAAVPVAALYNNCSIIYVFPASGLTFLLSGLTSLSPFILRRRLEFAKLNIFEVSIVGAYSVVQILLSYFYPNIWSLVLAIIFGSAVSAAGSYVLIPYFTHHFMIIRLYLIEIVSFGKWITLSSAIYFASMSFDRLYLAAAVPLDVLGIYGIARTVAELCSSLFFRIAGFVVFPFVASCSGGSRAALHSELAGPRLRLLLLSALAFGVLAATSDLTVNVLFDSRYRSAGWMLFCFVAGSWFAVLSSLNEATLLGFGKSIYGAVASGAKLIWLAVGLPIALAKYGIVGAVFVAASSDVCRYLTLSIGQFRERFSFFMQDLVTTLAFAVTVALCAWLRVRLGVDLPVKLPL